MGLLDGKVALVTGAAFGLGNAFARALAAEGAALAVCDIRAELSELAEDLSTPFELSHDDAPQCPWANEPPRTTGGGPDMDIYDAAKWGINGLTLAWSQALAEYGIRVNALAMGPTDTEMLRGLFDGNPPAEFAATWMKPEQIANQLLDLLREGPQGRSGENIGAWTGTPVELGPRKAPHRAITG